MLVFFKQQVLNVCRAILLKFTKQQIVAVSRAVTQSYKITVSKAMMQSYRNICRRISGICCRFCIVLEHLPENIRSLRDELLERIEPLKTVAQLGLGPNCATVIANQLRNQVTQPTERVYSCSCSLRRFITM